MSSFAFRCNGVDSVDDDAEVEAAVQKMLGLMGTMSSWPGFTSSITCCALLKTTLTATDSSVQRYATAVHSDSSRHVAEESFHWFAGNAMDATFCEGRFVYINAWRNITTDPIENNVAVCEETSLVAPDDYLASDLFMPGGFRLRQYGLSDHNAAKHRWYYLPHRFR